MIPSFLIIFEPAFKVSNIFRRSFVAIPLPLSLTVRDVSVIDNSIALPGVSGFIHSSREFATISSQMCLTPSSPT